MGYNTVAMPRSHSSSPPRIAPLWSALAGAALAAALWLAPAWAGPGDASADSVYLIGEFVDPVCIFQHGMQGVLQRKCAMVSGRVEQGMYFLDVRHRRLYSVIGQTHWEDPHRGFLEALGDTFAVTGRVWRRAPLPCVEGPSIPVLGER